VDRVKAFFVAAPQIARNSTTHRPATSQTFREPARPERALV
jgi:hypothetical protein